MQSEPVLRGDNGSTRKAATALAMHDWLGGETAVPLTVRLGRQCLRGAPVEGGQIKCCPASTMSGFADLGFHAQF